jgi:hypothetical protein
MLWCRTKRRIVYSFLVTLVLLQFGCDAGRRDIRRVRSGGYALEAVLVERNGGATSSLSYEVYIVAQGGDTSKAGKPIVRILMSTDPDGSIATEWVRPNQLVITCCEQAWLGDFTNWWNGADADGARRTVQTQLRTPTGMTRPLPQRAFY